MTAAAAAAGGTSSFAALGDSFTEGLDDPYPDGAGYRGWADQVAGALAQRAGPEGFRYANLAVRGRRMPEIVAEQVPPTLIWRPQLVSVAGGTNDALRRHFDPEAFENALRSAVAQLTANGSRVLLFTGTDPTRRVPAFRRLVPRFVAINDGVHTVAAEYDCLLVDLWPVAQIFDSPLMWSVDRLHLSSEGHRRVAGAVLEALGVPTGEDWRADPPPVPPAAWRHARMADVRWLRSYLGPWLHRRVTGRSSGDAVRAKHSSLEPYA